MNLFEMIGIDVPAEETKETKKTKEAAKKTKAVKKESKANISFPVKVAIQNFGTVEITSEDLGQEEATDADIKSYLKKKYSFINDSMSISLEKDIFYVGYLFAGIKNGSIMLAGDAKVSFGAFSLDMASVTDGSLDDGEAKTEDLAGFLSASGLMLGEPSSVGFISFSNNKILVPVPAKVKKEDFEKLRFPITVSFYGDYDDIVISPEKDVEINEKLICDAIEAAHPEFKKHIWLCNPDLENSSLRACLDVHASVSQAKKEELYKINSDTLLRFYATTIPVDAEQLPEGEYTLKDLCKYLAANGVPECNNSDSIIVKQIKNTICFAIKFGGSKGSGVIEEKVASALEAPFSVLEVSQGNLYVNIRPAWIYVEQDGASFFKMRLPKIPAEIYGKIINLFKTIAFTNNAECLARVYYDTISDEYVLHIPNQVARTASVSPVYDEQEDDFIFSHIPILEIHSHGKAFGAFFSHIDDADELNRNGIYGVVSFNKGIEERETSLFRVCSGSGRSKSICIEDIFEDISEDIFDISYDDEEFIFENVKKVQIL